MKTTRLEFVLLITAAVACAKELLQYDPNPNPASVVISGNMRFTVLTSQVYTIIFPDWIQARNHYLLTKANSLMLQFLLYMYVFGLRYILLNTQPFHTIFLNKVIRIEESDVGAFENRRTIAMLNRNLPKPIFTAATAGGVLTITTQHLILTYPVGGALAAIVVVGSAPGAF